MSENMSPAGTSGISRASSAMTRQTALITRSRRAAVRWPVSLTLHPDFSVRCQPPQGVPTHDPHGVFDGRNGDRGKQEPPVWRRGFGSLNDLNGKRRGSARRWRQQDGTNLHVGDAFLAPVRRLAFADLGPLAQARDRKFPMPLNRRGADAVEQLLRFRQLPAVPGAHQNDCRGAAARRTFRRSPLPGTLTSCVPSSRLGAAVIHRADLRSSGSLSLPGRGASNSSFSRPSGKPASSTAIVVWKPGGLGAGLVVLCPGRRTAHASRSSGRCRPEGTEPRVRPERAFLVRRQDVFRRDRPRLVARPTNGKTPSLPPCSRPPPPRRERAAPPPGHGRCRPGASPDACLPTAHLRTRSRPNTRATTPRRPAPEGPAGRLAPPGNPGSYISFTDSAASPFRSCRPRPRVVPT